MKKYLLSIFLSLLLISPLYSGEIYEQSWKAGKKDINNKRMNGSEILKITAHKGMLFAATSMWMESSGKLGGAQVLVKEGHKSPWKVDYQFGKDNKRCTSLVSSMFSTDYKGRRIKPVNMLFAASTTKKGYMINIYSRNDKTGKWISFSIGKAKDTSQVRGMGFYRDRKTGVDMVFAGISGNKKSAASIGMVTGSYKQGAKGGIAWNKKPELNLPAHERFMEFTECNGVFFVSSTKKIFKRIDGKDPKWVCVFDDPDMIAPVGIRGLATVPKVGGKGEELIFITRAKIRRLDPAENNRVTVELDMPAFLTKKWKLPVQNTLSGYNKIVAYTGPSGETRHLVGFQSSYDRKWIRKEKPKDLLIKVRNDGRRPITYFAGEGRYLIRSVKNNKPIYEIKTIKDPTRSLLGAVRTITKSPFKEDKHMVLYMGGIDCNGIPHHDTGWIFRVEMQQ